MELKVTTFSVNKWAKSESDIATHIYIYCKCQTKTELGRTLRFKTNNKKRVARESFLVEMVSCMAYILYFGGAAARKNTIHTYVCAGCYKLVNGVGDRLTRRYYTVVLWKRAAWDWSLLRKNERGQTQDIDR